MRKVFPGIVGYVFLSINSALILGACMKPVDTNLFLGNGKDKEIPSNSKTGVGIEEIDFEEPEDIPPVLQANIGGVISPVAADKTVLVSLSSLGSDAITVINMNEYDTVEWHYNSHPVESGVTFTLGSMIAIFKVIGVYPVTAVGKKGNILYSTLFYINVGS